MDPFSLLFCTILPVVIAGTVLGLVPLAQRLIGFRVTEPLSSAMGALALGLAYGFSLPGVRGGLPDVPPVDATNWPWALIPATVVVAMLEGVCGKIPPLRWVARSALVGIGVWLVSRPHVANVYEGAPEAWLALFVFSLFVVFYLLQLDGLAKRGAQPPSFLALVVAVSASAVLCVLASTAVLGQLCGILAAGLFALGVLSWKRPELSPLRGVAPVLGITHGLLILSAVLYSDLPASAAALLALTPGAAFLSRAGRLSRLPGWLSLLTALVLIASLAGIAGALTLGAAPPAIEPGDW